MNTPRIDYAIIGGTGLYRLEGLENVHRSVPDTPFGKPSGAVVTGELHGRHYAFLARHGEDHSLPPHRVNYRANMHALFQFGARAVIGVNAVGGIRPDMSPRTIAVPDQIIDYTHGRASSFCDVEGAEVRHVDFSEPYSADLRTALLRAAAKAGVDIVDGGCYGATQGPRLETRAEIARMRRDGCDLVGMTGMPEAVLARELDLPYACLSMVANWAAGCGEQAEIGMQEIFDNLRQTTSRIPHILAALA